MTGTPQNKHLEKIEDDQSINGINTIDDTIRNEAGRHWFVSQAIQPVMIMGRYGDVQGRMNLGMAFTPAISTTSVSAAASTLTCAAGHRYKVYFASAMNATQATTVTLTGTLNGNAVNFHTTASLTVPILVIGGGYGSTTTQFRTAELWLNPGDTLTLTINTYAAGNDTEHVFMYEDWSV